MRKVLLAGFTSLAFITAPNAEDRPIHGAECVVVAKQVEVYNIGGKIVRYFKKGEHFDANFRAVEPDHPNWLPLDIEDGILFVNDDNRISCK